MKSIPIDKIVLETDSPYLMPEGVVGKRNTSKNLNVILKKLAELRCESPEHIREVVLKNTKRLYPQYLSDEIRRFVMKKMELIIKQELFDKIGVEIGQLHYEINKDNDFRLCGSVSSDNVKLAGYSLYLSANLCNEKGEILYVDKSYSSISFEMVNYDAFSMYCSDLSRFFDVEQLHHIEIYPNVRKLSEED